MKTLLVAPSQSDIYGRFSAPDYPPLGLGYLAAVLKKSGHEVKITDIDADKISEQDFIRHLKIENFDLVGITATTPTFNKAIRISKLVKENSRAITVLGGIHITVMPEESMKYDSVDFAVVGEGEQTIVELTNLLGERRDLESVDGIYYRKNGKIIKNKERELIEDLDGIPMPERSLFKQQNYTYPDTLYRHSFPIITSRGCPSDCSYCNSKNIFKRKFRTRSPAAIVDEIEYLRRNFKAKEIHIWDDNFTVLRERVFRIRDEIKRKNIKLKFAFPNGLRVDCIDLEILKALKEMGTYSIAFGVESGNQEVLNSINKKIRLDQIEQAFKLAKKIGIETWGFFMIGLPSETASSIKNTIDFAIKLNPQVAKFHIFKPFPGTKAYEYLLKRKMILDTDFDKYGIHTAPVHRLDSLSPGQIIVWQKHAYRSFYFRPVTLLKQILRIKTFNRLKNNFSAGRSILKFIINKE